MFCSLPKTNTVSFGVGEREVGREALCSWFASTCSAWSQSLVSRFTRRTRRGVCSTCGQSPQTSCSWVSAEELPGRKGAVRWKYHTGQCRVQNKPLAQSQTLLQLEAICTVHVFFWKLREHSPCLVPCDLYACKGCPWMDPGSCSMQSSSSCSVLSIS